MPFSGFGDLNPDYAFRLQAFINASGGRISVTSGYRSIERQTQLWNQALAKYGDPEIADNWVARPGKSNHNHGIAADLGFANADARRWAHANAARFGLHFPMSWEPWHIEPLGSVQNSDRGAYTTPPAGSGFVNPRDAVEGGLDPFGNAEDPYDPGVQMRRLFSVIEAGPDAQQAAMASPEQGLEAPSVGGDTGGSSEGGGLEPEAALAQISQLVQEEA